MNTGLLVKAHGRKTQSGIVQTPTTLYVQLSDGQWTSGPATLQDQVDVTTEQLQTAKVTCQRVGTDSLNGTAATVYDFRIDQEGSARVSKIWIAGHLVLRSGTSSKEDPPFGVTALYDYVHFDVPANVKPLPAGE